MSETPALTLDPQSRRALREVSIQASIGAAIMLAVAALGLQSLSEVAQAAVRVFTFYSCIDCIRAAGRREPLWRPSLTRWDQAAAYTLCAIAIDAVVRWNA